ncbi:hypothetical protein [Nonomuraea dietziae]|uniref:hypothetical protein n=1 Tax=Nonomuraea dietziae TaxID=65515 RepID=UPI0031D27B2A
MDSTTPPGRSSPRLMAASEEAASPNGEGLRSWGKTTGTVNFRKALTRAGADGGGYDRRGSSLAGVP